MKAARMHEYGKPAVLEDVPIPQIQPDELLINVKACGMCRSDVQLIDGYFRPYNDIPTPITLGHEITGVVHTIGAAVPKAAGLKEGDHVAVAPGWGDGVCRHCLIGNTHICPTFVGRVSARTAGSPSFFRCRRATWSRPILVSLSRSSRRSPMQV